MEDEELMKAFHHVLKAPVPVATLRPTATLYPWSVAEADFPTDGTPAAKLRFLLNYAVLAPSRHNAQPWLWKIHDDAVELYADRSRSLAATDPDDRELTIGCGAALLYLRLALRYFGYSGPVQAFPEPQEPDLLARVGLGRKVSSNAQAKLLFRAIPERHTNQRPFENRAVPATLLPTLQAEAAIEGAWMQIIRHQSSRSEIAALIAWADVELGHDPPYRHELARWMHPNYSTQHDGIPGYALGMNAALSYLAPVATRWLDRGEVQANKDWRLATNAPVLAVLGTDENTPRAWLATGQALARVLLRASAAGISAAFFSQPTEIRGLRTRLAHAVGREGSRAVGQEGFPQLLFGLGYAAAARPTPRRAVAEVLAC
jgi:nitroreductase